jgi:hypothetical protein
VLVIACWQAFQARDIKSEFTEAKYIGLTVFSISQAFLTGIPIVALVRDIPETFYVVLTLLIFVLCMVILLLIFLPKFLMERVYANMSAADRRKMMAMSVRKSSIHFSTMNGLHSARDGSAGAFSSRNHDGSAGAFALKPQEEPAGTPSVPLEEPPDVPGSAPVEKTPDASAGALSPSCEEAEAEETANDVADTKGCFSDDKKRGGRSEEAPLWSSCGSTVVEA